MEEFKSIWSKIFLIFLSSAIICCGNTSSNSEKNKTDNETAEAGIIPSELSTYCTVTILKDVQMKFIDSDWYSLKSGEKLLKVASFGKGGIRFTQSGKGYEVRDIKENDFKSDCESSEQRTYLVALTDVDVYSESELQTKVCSLRRGESVEANSYGYAIASGLDIFKISAKTFFPKCASPTGNYFVKFKKFELNNVNTTQSTFDLLNKQ